MDLKWAFFHRVNQLTRKMIKEILILNVHGPSAGCAGMAVDIHEQVACGLCRLRKKNGGAVTCHFSLEELK